LIKPGQELKEGIKRIGRVLIVSCQASEGEPLCSPAHIAALAQSAIMGGAGALRLEGAANIAAVRALTKLPIIGLAKSSAVPESERLKSVYITATFAEAEEIAKAGSDIVAIDATGRARVEGTSLSEFIGRIHSQLGKPVMADISSLSEGLMAVKAGADLVSTTLYGYTEETVLPSDAEPGLDLLRSLVEKCDLPVILEGRVWHPDEVTRAFAYGAYAVVVGSAITRPQLITKRFVRAIPAAPDRDER
jgi:N-acylglucosamine-6-phosphate 2-epimerase